MEQSQVKQIIDSYILAFNQSDSDALVSLFTEDAVLMAPDLPTMEGKVQLKAFMQHGFSLVSMKAEIEYDEVVINGNSAYVRTHSRVLVTDLKSKLSQPEEDRELFLLNKTNGAWKISRYMFNKKPALTNHSA